MGIPTLIGSAHTASDASSVDISSGIDSTYDEYMFVFTDIAPDTDNANLGFQVNATDGDGYNDSRIISSVPRMRHGEDGSLGDLIETDAEELLGALTYCTLAAYLGSGSDESVSGILHLFNPSSTALYKNFYSRFQGNISGDAKTVQWLVCGFIYDVTAIDDISFKMSSGNFDGVIQMYGIA